MTDGRNQFQAGGNEGGVSGVEVAGALVFLAGCLPAAINEWPYAVRIAKRDDTLAGQHRNHRVRALDSLVGFGNGSEYLFRG